MAAPNIEDVPGWLTQAEADALHALAYQRRALEIGSFCGRSSAAIGTAAASLMCVDPFDGRGTPFPQDTLPRFRDTMRKFNLTHRVNYTQATAEEWAALTAPRIFDLVFIDGDHTAASLASNLEAVHRLTYTGGIVALHDYGHKDYPDVARVAHGFFHRPPDRLVDSLAVYLMDGPFPGRLLNVVTPSHRPKYRTAVMKSVAGLVTDLPGWVVHWYVGLDRSDDYADHVPGSYKTFRQSAGSYGNGGRNDALDMIRGGWVHFLDDDNEIHPEFAAGLRRCVADYPEAPGFVFPQMTADGSARLGANVNAAPGFIDSAQFVFSRAAIGSSRWPLDNYGADGMFFDQVRNRSMPEVAPAGAVWYNKLRG